MDLPLLSWRPQAAPLLRACKVFDPPTQNPLWHFYWTQEPISQQSWCNSGTWPWDLLLLFHTTLHISCQLSRVMKWLFEGTTALPLWRWHSAKMEWHLRCRNIHDISVIVIWACVLDRHNTWFSNPREGSRMALGSIYHYSQRPLVVLFMLLVPATLDSVGLGFLVIG